MSFVYAAQPIDQAGRISQHMYSLMRAACSTLADLGHTVYRPDLAFETTDPGAQIQRVNEFALQSADGGVALLPAGVPSLGTPAEVQQLVGSGRPVLVLTDLTRSAVLRRWAEWDHVKVVPLDSVTDVDAGLAWLVEQMGLRAKFDRGLVPLVFQAVGSGCVTADDLTERSLLPRRSHHDDAGLDLFVSQDIEIAAGGFADVPSGVRADLPVGTWAMIVGRSSTLRKRGLLVSTGVIDAGWTGELFAGVQNLGAEPVRVPAGDRLAQLILLPAPVTGFVPRWGSVTPNKSRGEAGFGSSGA